MKQAGDHDVVMVWRRRGEGRRRDDAAMVEAVMAWWQSKRDGAAISGAVMPQR